MEAERNMRKLYVKEYVEQIEGYTSYLEEIAEQQTTVNQMVHIKNDSYALRLIELTAKAYEPMKGTVLQAADPVGAEMVLQGKVSVSLLCAFVVALCVFLFSYEKEQQVLSLLCPSYLGKRGCYLGKIIVDCLGAAAFAITIFEARLLWSVSLLDLGNLKRPIQTIPDFYTCAWPLTVGQTLLLHEFVLIAGAILVVFLCSGICIWLDGAAAWAAMIGVFAAAYGSYRWIPESAVFQPLRYWNLCALFQTELFVRGTVYLKIASRPVSFYGAVAGLSIMILLFGIGVGLSGKSCLKKAKKSRYRKNRKRKSIQDLEWKKVLLPQYGYLLVIGCLVLQVVSFDYFYGGMGMEEQLYRMEVERVQGSYTEEKNAQIQMKYRKMAEQFSAGDEEELRSVERLADLSLYLQKQDERAEVSYVYGRGYEALMGLWKVGWRYQPFVIGTVLLLLLAGIFSYEKESGMESLCKITFQWEKLQKQKIQIAFWMTAFLYGINWLPEILFIWKTYPLYGSSASVVSLQKLEEVPSAFSLRGLVLWIWGLRFLGTLLWTAVILVCSRNSKSYLQSVVKGGSFWALQIVLYAVLPERWEMASLVGIMSGSGGWDFSWETFLAMALGGILTAIWIMLAYRKDKEYNRGNFRKI